MFYFLGLISGSDLRYIDLPSLTSENLEANFLNFLPLLLTTKQWQCFYHALLNLQNDPNNSTSLFWSTKKDTSYHHFSGQASCSCLHKVQSSDTLHYIYIIYNPSPIVLWQQITSGDPYISHRCIYKADFSDLWTHNSWISYLCLFAQQPHSWY